MYHVIGKTYGWTPDQVDGIDVDTLDWLFAIQRVEREIEEQERSKRDQEMKRQSAAIQRRRRM